MAHAPGPEPSPKDPNTESKKATKAEVIQRVTALVPALLSGMRHNEIVRYAMAPTEDKGLGWTLSKRQVENYIARATKEIEKDAAVDRRKVLAHSRARLNFLYAQAVRKGDLRNALQVQREIHALYGFVSHRPEFNQSQVVNQTTVAAASASATNIATVRESIARRIFDIKRRQDLELLDDEQPDELPSPNGHQPPLEDTA